MTAIPGYISATTYAPDGQTASITYANGVTTTFTYSPTRRWLTRVDTKNEDGVNIVASAFTRDGTGRITTLATDPGNDYTYTYDAFGRLTAATTGTAAESRTYGYDANGNMTSDGRRTFLWDDANRLSRVTLLNGAAADVAVSFAYGPDGARVKKSSTFGTTLYPDANVEHDPATDVYTRYVGFLDEPGQSLGDIREGFVAGRRDVLDFQGLHEALRLRVLTGIADGIHRAFQSRCIKRTAIGPLAYWHPRSVEWMQRVGGLLFSIAECNAANASGVSKRLDGA